MASADVSVNVHDTDAATWRALSTVFPVSVSEDGLHEWVAIREQGTGVLVTFFAPRGWGVGAAADAAGDDRDHEAVTVLHPRSKCGAGGCPLCLPEGNAA